MKLGLLKILRLLHLINKKDYNEKRQIEIVKKSPLFDKKWYLSQNPDVKAKKIGAAKHYIKYGWKEGRNPSPHFDTNEYLEEYPELVSKNWCPLFHYMLEHKGKVIKYEKNGKIEVLKIKDNFKFPAKAKNFEKSFSVNTKKGRTAVFAVFTADGKIPETTIYYLKGLKEVVSNIILVADNPIFEEEIEKIKDLVCYCSFSRHQEYDFGSYKRGFIYAKEKGILENTTELILCNDSCYGPVYPFSEMFEEMNKRNVDFWEICANKKYEYHLQSYFLVFRPKVFSSDVFYNFVTGIEKQINVQQVILKYETKFTSILKNAGFEFDSYIKYEYNETEYPYSFNSNLTFFPIWLMNKKCPLVKVKAIYNNVCNCEGVENTIDYIREKNKSLAKLIKVEEKNILNVQFSVIMPTYNRKQIIGNAIDSLLCQTHQNFELIIVDDGSTDGTQKYVEEKYKKEIKEGKIRYFYKENEGVCKARNYGLQRAKNEWITYLDSDNLMYPIFLEVFARNMSNNDNKIFYARFRNKNKDNVVGKEFNLDNLLIGNYIDLGAFCHHYSVYEELGGFDENMTRLVDWELIVRYTKKYEPKYIAYPIMLYNDSNDYVRISNSCDLEKNKDYFRKKHCKHFSTVTTMITTYNHEKYIAQAIDSAIKQTGNFIHEILISDDGSTDNTPKIIEEYAKKYPYLIKNISSKQNIGISANMKKCFETASGKYIAVLEGDDYWIDAKKLQKQIDFLEKNKDCSMVFSRLKLLNEKNKTFSFLERQNNLPTKLTGNSIIIIIGLNIIGNFSCCMFKSEYMKNLPEILFKYRFSEIPLSFYLERKGKIGFISTPLSVYRQHTNGVWTGASRRQQLEQALKVRQITLEVCANKYKKDIQRIIDEQYKEPLNKLVS